jgi:hypothetical protein
VVSTWWMDSRFVANWRGFLKNSQARGWVTRRTEKRPPMPQLIWCEERGVVFHISDAPDTAKSIADESAAQ